MKGRILPIIAVSFGFAALLQVSNFSFAAADSKEETPEEAVETPKAENSLGDIPAMSETASDTQICLTTTMADAILSEKDRIEAQKIALNEREAALEALETKLSQQLDNIKETKASVEAKLKTMEIVSTEDLDHLISMYETMKPKKAAEIFDSMAPAFAAGFLRDMNSAKAGMIMSEMNARKSYEISLVIANRNAAIRNADQQ
jgi:flagellar motility protein MotE (MotC chaperone)